MPRDLQSAMGQMLTSIEEQAEGIVEGDQSLQLPFPAVVSHASGILSVLACKEGADAEAQMTAGPANGQANG